MARKKVVTSNDDNRWFWIMRQEAKGFSSKATLQAAIYEAINTPEFLEMYDKLRKTSFSKRQSPINEMIDKATGFKDHQTRELYEFIRDYIWYPWFVSL